mmetsp:Transcript_43923/g.80265  ORF Transcript_43923/g.80265 Transcript_43923/m.80265 type:complete len:241 (+) Transcript_43923:188-910(+)
MDGKAHTQPRRLQLQSYHSTWCVKCSVSLARQVWSQGWNYTILEPLKAEPPSSRETNLLQECGHNNFFHGQLHRPLGEDLEEQDSDGEPRQGVVQLSNMVKVPVSKPPLELGQRRVCKEGRHVRDTSCIDELIELSHHVWQNPIEQLVSSHDTFPVNIKALADKPLDILLLHWEDGGDGCRYLSGACVVIAAPIKEAEEILALHGLDAWHGHEAIHCFARYRADIPGQLETAILREHTLS